MNLATYGTISLKETPKLGEQILHKDKDKDKERTHCSEQERLRHDLPIGPTPAQPPTLRRELATWSPFLPEEGREGSSHVAPELLRPAPERWAPKHLALNAKGASVHKTPQTGANWETVHKKLMGTRPPKAQPNGIHLKSTQTSL